MLKFDPAVFAVGKTYQIIVTTKINAFISIKIGDSQFFDDSNGILCSKSRTHKITVPMDLLDKSCAYTIVEERIIKRLPYFTKTGKINSYDYAFKPIPADSPKAYHIADTHNEVDDPVAAAEAFGEFDFLILNGDIPNDSGKPENLYTVFEIAEKVTHGEKPIVFARGNHDLRGVCAEMFADFTPAMNGNTYYSFRLGSLWGLILDCGEDKPDSNEEYGHTVACHPFRLRETKYIYDVISDAENEYADPSVTHRLIISHNPFTCRYPAPFDIEEDLYSEWASVIKENIKPDVMICGHLHKLYVDRPGSERDGLGHPCTVVVGARKGNDMPYAGTGFAFEKENITVTFTDCEGSVVGTDTISLGEEEK